MADEYGYDDENNEPDPSELHPRDLRRQLAEAKAEAKTARELREQNERLQREITIRDAGLTLNDRQRTALAAAHNGDWSPDSLRKTAEELGWHKPEPAAPVVDDPSLAALDQIAQASAGTDPVPASRDAEIDARLAAAKTPDEYMAIYRESGRAIVL